MNDEEEINQFLEPPKRVRITDVRVCIMELETDVGFLHTFLFAYPFSDEESGVIKVFNPSYTDINKYVRTKELPSKLLMWQAYWRIKKRALESNTKLTLLYDGIIGRDDRYYGIR